MVTGGAGKQQWQAKTQVQEQAIKDRDRPAIEAINGKISFLEQTRVALNGGSTIVGGGTQKSQSQGPFVWLFIRRWAQNRSFDTIYSGRRGDGYMAAMVLGMPARLSRTRPADNKSAQSLTAGPWSI
jgi:hypothetical protein